MFGLHNLYRSILLCIVNYCCDHPPGKNPVCATENTNIIKLLSSSLALAPDIWIWIFLFDIRRTNTFETIRQEGGGAVRRLSGRVTRVYAPWTKITASVYFVGQGGLRKNHLRGLTPPPFVHTFECCSGRLFPGKKINTRREKSKINHYGAAAAPVGDETRPADGTPAPRAPVGLPRRRINL